MIRLKKSIQQMKPYHPPIEERQGYLRLDFNENTLGPSPKAMKYLRRVRPEDISCYPHYSEAKQELARYLGLRPAQVILTNGTDEAIRLIFTCYCEPGNRVVILEPSYAMYRFYAEAAGASIKTLRYNPDFSFPYQPLLKMITAQTRLVILGSPNNPTGTTVPIAAVRAILKRLKRGLVLLDEAYYEFHGRSALSLIRGNNNLVVTRTFSKAYGLAGLRIGLLISSPNRIAEMSRCHSPYSVNQVAVETARVAIKDGQYVKKYTKSVKQSRALLMSTLSKIGIKTYPSSANFMIARVGPKREWLVKQMAKAGILLREPSKHHMLKDCIRIGIGTLQQTKRFLKTLQKIGFKGNK